MIELDSIFEMVRAGIDWLQPLLLLIKGQTLYFSLSLAAANFALLLLVSLRHYPSQPALNTIKLFLVVPILLAVSSVAVNFLDNQKANLALNRVQQENTTLTRLKDRLTHLHETNMELEDKLRSSQQEHEAVKKNAQQLEVQLNQGLTNSNLNNLKHIAGLSSDRVLKKEIARFEQFFESRKIQISPQQSAYFLNKPSSTLKITVGFPPTKNTISSIEIENIYLDHIALPEELSAYSELTYFGYTEDIIKAIYGPPKQQPQGKKALNNNTQHNTIRYYLAIDGQQNLVADFTFKKDKLAIIKVSWP